MGDQTNSAAQGFVPGPILSKLIAKGWSHWIIAVLVLILGMVITRYADEYLRLDELRNALSQKLLQWYWRPLEPRVVRLVLIGDDEYWRGALAGRVPIKRDYLARVVEALDSANASLIALDFDMRLPDPRELTDFPDYRQESELLARTVVAVAHNRKVVLSKTIRRAGAGTYRLEPDLYQLFGICSQLSPSGRWQHAGTPQLPIDAHAANNINCGYIALTSDKRELPNQVPIIGGLNLDSFSLAITRAHNPRIAAEIAGAVRYGSYIPPGKLDDPGTVYSAHDLLQGNPETLAALNGQVVIVGADWSTLADGRGGKIDVHSTPVGPMSGTKIHANFAEAYFDSRTYRRVPEVVTVAIEAALCMAAAVTFALIPGIGYKILALIGATAVLVLIEWITLHLLGLFLEVFIPFVGVWIHSLIEGGIAGAREA